MNTHGWQWDSKHRKLHRVREIEVADEGGCDGVSLCALKDYFIMPQTAWRNDWHFCELCLLKFREQTENEQRRRDESFVDEDYFGE